MSTSGNRSIHSSFRFLVELDGLLVGGFQEVSGLEQEVMLEQIREGGLNAYSHSFVKGIRTSPIQLRRGLGSSSELWNWYDAVQNGTITRKNGAIIMLGEDGNEVCRWNFYEAMPRKWYGPSFRSDRSEIAIEGIELVHKGLKWVSSGGT